MIVDTLNLSPVWGIPVSNGMIDGRPGAVLGLMKELRIRCGTLKATKKEGVRFMIRSLDRLVDLIRKPANDLGLLIYPAQAAGKGFVVEDGTLAECNLTVRIQAIEDGSYLDICGFGLGADNQDKAGGKAGSYAFKQALIQALLAGGADDTDDTDTPIKGGIRPKQTGQSQHDLGKLLDAAMVEEAYKFAIALVRQAAPETQLAVRDNVIAAKKRCGL